jgi:OMF family outer membrane factor
MKTFHPLILVTLGAATAVTQVPTSSYAQAIRQVPAEKSSTDSQPVNLAADGGDVIVHRDFEPPPESLPNSQVIHVPQTIQPEVIAFPLSATPKTTAVAGLTTALTPRPQAIEPESALQQKQADLAATSAAILQQTVVSGSLPLLQRPQELAQVTPPPLVLPTTGTPEVDLSPPPNPNPTAPPPEYLNPPPNPLNFPTNPEEVKIQGAQPLSLKQVLELAQRNSPILQQAQLQVDNSQAVLREAQAALFPSLFLNSTLARGITAATDFSVQAQRNRQQRLEAFLRREVLPAQPTTIWQNSLQLSYNVFTSGSRSAQIQAAEQQVRLTQLQLEQAKEQLRFDISTAYYNLQDTDTLVKIAEAAVRQSQSNLKDAQAQFDAGLGTKFDVLRAQVDLANNQQQVARTTADRDTSRRELARLMNLAENVLVVPSDPVEPSGNWPFSLEESVVLAYKNRAELQQELVQRDISDARRRQALAALGPTFSVSAEGTTFDQFEELAGTGLGYNFQAQLQWQLFDGGAARARAKQQEIAKQTAEQRFQEQRSTIRRDVEQAHNNLIANQDSIKTGQIAVVQAREALRLAVLRFQAGVGTQTDRINAETDLTRARANLLSSILGYNRALVQLYRAVSNLSPEPPKTSPPASQ